MFKKCQITNNILKSRFNKIFNGLNFTQQKNFSTTGLTTADQNKTVNNFEVTIKIYFTYLFQSNAVLTKLIEKDVSYFSELLNQKGAEYTLRQLENVSLTADINTQMGRELIKTKNEIVTILVYQERSVDE